MLFVSIFLFQHMVKMSFDVVKRWVNEAQEAASSDNIMVQVSEMFTSLFYELVTCLSLIKWDLSPQYHALGLLYHLRKNDRLAVTKMLNKFTKSGLKSPFAYCMMIRIASKLLEETEGGYVCWTSAFFRRY